MPSLTPPRRAHRPTVRAAFAVAALGALLAVPAHAQTTPVVEAGLPFVSVGDAIKWNQPSEQYTVRVRDDQAGTPVNLEVYSPALNLEDYVGGRAKNGYYGDELYARTGSFTTTFTLTGPQGLIVERTYGTTQEHAWESLIATPLPPGTYTLRVSSKGNGKNAYALRAAPGFTLEASDFTVNARGTPQDQLLAARFTVPRDWVGKTLELVNDDADGTSELALDVLLPSGEHRALTVSPDTGAATDRVTITPELVGEWAVYANVQATSKQFSNAFILRFKLDGRPVTARLPTFTPPAGAQLTNAVNVEVVDTIGRVIPGASYALSADGTLKVRLPGSYVPQAASVTEGAGQVTNASEVRLQPGSARVRFVARAQEGALSVDAVAIFGTTRVPLTGIPVEVAGRTQNAPFTLALAPGDYRVNPTPLPGANVQPTAGRVTDAGTARVTVEYHVTADVSVITNPDLVEACSVTQLTATARTDFPYRVPAVLNVTLPAGWNSDYPLEFRGDLSATSPLRLKVPLRVCRTDTATVTLGPVSLQAGGSVQVRNPAGATVTRVASPDTRVRVAKNAAATANGYVVTLHVTVEGTVENLRVLDPLPGGGNTPALRGTLTAQGGRLAAPPRVEGEVILLGRVTAGTYTLTYTLFTDLAPDRVITTPDLLW